MLDFKLTWDADEGVAVLDFADNDIVTDEGLTTPVIVSLFSDRQAREDDTLPDPNSTDRRGWWGDQTSEKDNDFIGSRLWLLGRAKTTQEITENAELFATEALQWMIDEGVAVDIKVTAERVEPSPENNRLDLLVQIFKKSGDVETLKFENAWEATINGT